VRGQDLLLYEAAHAQDAILDVSHLGIEALPDVRRMALGLGLSFGDRVGSGGGRFDGRCAGGFVQGLHRRLLALVRAHPNRPEM